MAVIGVKIEERGKRVSAAASVTASRARRCLFERPTETDSVDTMSEWRQHEQLVDDEKRRYWNFDFQQMTPLPGRWQWEPIRPVTSTVCRGPDDGRPTASGGSSSSTSTEVTSPPPVNTGISTTAVETSSTTETPTCNSEPRRKRRRQTTLQGIVRSYLYHVYMIL